MKCRLRQQSFGLRWLSVLIAGAVTAMAISLPAKAQSTGASFQGLGDLPGEVFGSQARGVSDDGNVVVGIGTLEGSRPFRWTSSGGMVELPDGGTNESAFAIEVSGNGVITLGNTLAGDPPFDGVYWINTSFVDFIDGRPVAASRDGTVMTGTSPAGAFRWENGVTTLLGAGPLASPANITPDGLTIVGGIATSPATGFSWTQAQGAIPLPLRAYDVSADGLVVVGDVFSGGVYQAARWTQAGGLEVLAPPGAFGSRADGVSFTGNLIGISGSPLAARIWDPVNGLRDLKQVLVDGGATGLGGWTLTQIADISPDGINVVGQGINPAGQLEAFRARLPDVDTDGDGLLDNWETNGIPYTDALGVQQHYLLDVDGDGNSDADPNHKDLFVEIDAVDAPGIAPSLTDLSPVIAAFNNAPVTNPDGTTGIVLHLHIDEPTIAVVGGFPSPWAEFDLVKSQVASGTILPGYFGTVDDRNHVDGSERLQARRKAFRYCLFATTILGDDTSGIAELPGNDFIVALGAWSTPGGTSEQKAGTFMHELGHTLGLGHGGRDPVTGPDHTNYKPNYYSVMNYSWTTPQPWMTPGSWPLSTGRPGFSQNDLIALNEAALEECIGVFAPFGSFEGIVVMHNTHASLVMVTYDWMCCSIDWNADLMTSCAPDTVAVDLNHILATEPASPGEVLIGREDWSQLIYDFKTSPDFADGMHQTTIGQPPELTFEEHEALSRILPPFCSGDTNLDRTVNVVDLLAVINNWAVSGGTLADTNGDGAVNVADLLIVINAWGPCR